MVNKILDSYTTSKLGNAINIILSDLLKLNDGDKIKTIDEYVENYNFSKGTYFNALVAIESNDFAIFKRKGHIGTIVNNINYLEIWKYLVKNKFVVVLPFPDDLPLKILATAINNVLHNQKQVNSYLLYARGGEARSSLLRDNIADLSIMTKLSYEIVSEIDEKFKLLYEIENPQYEPSVRVLIKKGRQLKLEKQKEIRILYDESSYDVRLLANIIFKDQEIVFVNHSYTQTIELLENDLVDAAIYNFSESDAVKYPGVEILDFEDEIVNQKLTDASRVYLVYYENQKTPIQKIANKILDRERIIAEYSKIIQSKEILNY